MAADGNVVVPASSGVRMDGESQRGLKKEKDVRMSNIMAAKAIADAIRTSLGPRGMDKMIQKGDNEVLITNDGATIMSQLEVAHPTAKMLVELSKSQDIEAGDGTTSVCVIAGSLLEACAQLLNKGVHATSIAEAFMRAADKAEEILESASKPVDLEDKATLVDAVTTCLASKVVSQNSDTLAPIAVEAVLSILNGESPDLSQIKIVKQVGGTVDDTELVDGLVFAQGAKKAAGGPTRIENAKIALIQFCLSAPKTDMENNVVVSDYAAMDRLLREERKHVLGLCKKIKKAGVNVLLIQKSILRDAYNDLSLHFLAKMGILCVADVERSDVDFISRTLNLLPVAHVDSLETAKLGEAKLVHEVSMPGSNQKVVKVEGVPCEHASTTILVRGSNKLVLEEADRSLHDALCVVRALVKKRSLIAGGGAPEAEIALKLADYAKTLAGKNAFCVRAFADALEVVPYTLAENAGLNPIAIVTELRKRHRAGEVDAGINVKQGTISHMYQEHVIQPLLVNTSAIHLATECICMILKIDDLVLVR
ncbi:hypothetical protein CTAYLR_002566 [Chrysophaeum taylorii]|uniref:T-complex protein 1 subunit delta n=1 Tax=Chrysophaeum taylorii TaxID=2483200 RepID=A0AAD7XMG7_9STRA|nr:hypothetical protein CTAYLR_002566 [Chrysophaeum taylorii]